MPSDQEIAAALAAVSTATLTTVLLKQGVRNAWMRGAAPLGAARGRVAGRAFTLRFIPMREDLATPAAWSSPRSTRVAVEQVPAGSVVVVDAMGVADAGILGDILCARLHRRGAAALVTDGAVRDAQGVQATGLPVWCRGAAAPAAIASLVFAGWQEPIGCGGVAVYPGDFVVADGDGAVVVPAALAEAVAGAAGEQERLEDWILEQVGQGAALPGLYPPDEANRARYEEARRARDAPPSGR